MGLFYAVLESSPEAFAEVIENGEITEPLREARRVTTMVAENQMNMGAAMMSREVSHASWKPTAAGTGYLFKYRLSTSGTYIRIEREIERLITYLGGAVQTDVAPIGPMVRGL